MPRLASLAALALAGCGLVSSPVEEAPEPAVHARTVLSETYHIDRKYKSMTGPWSQEDVTLLDAEAPELLWITGYRTDVVDARSGEALGQEFMCHANLDFDVERYHQDFDKKFGLSGRVFTLSQGQQEIAFPEGFGIPVLSNRPLQLTTQVLNLNRPSPDLDVRHQVTIEFVRDAEATTPMKPLFQAAAQGFKSLEGEGMHYGVMDPSMEEHGAGCAVGSTAIEDDVDLDPFGRKFTAHWVVEPGREETRTLVTEFLNLPFDTTVHYIAVHLHPFAESLELIDRSAGKTVFRSEVDPSEGRIGIDRVDYLSSVEGVPMYAEHEYELVAVYDNTLDEPVDSMAVMYLYLLDPQFEKPDLSAVADLPAPEDDVIPAGGLPPGM